MQKINIGQSFNINNIKPSLDAYFIAKNYTSGTWIVICAHLIDLDRLSTEINYFNPDLKVNIFNDRELLPYDHFSAHADLISNRMATLYTLNQQQCNILLIGASTAAQKIAPSYFLAQYSFNIKRGQKFNEQLFHAQMRTAGYNHVKNSVMHAGEFCIRGGIIDIFPMGSLLPYRIDLFDDEVESIKVFNIDSQSSLYEVDDINMLPSYEFAFDDDSRALFLNNFASLFNTKSIIYKNMQQKIAMGGIENYLPLFFKDMQTATIFEYLQNNENNKDNSNNYIVTIGDIATSINDTWVEASRHFKYFAGDVDRPLLAPEKLYLNQEQFFTLLKKFPRLNLLNNYENNSDNSNDSNDSNDTKVNIEPIYISKDTVLFDIFCAKYIQQGYKLIISSDSLGRLSSIQDTLRKNNIEYINIEDLNSISTLKSGLYTNQNSIHNGFIHHADKVIFITEQELFSNYIRRTNKKQEKSSDIDNIIQDIAELNIGDAVVHSQHGIGRYMGLVSINTSADYKIENIEDFIELQYAKEAKLYVPIQHINLISRYSGSDIEHTPLHTLGSEQWEKAKRKAAEKIYDTAAELLDMYAKRSLREGYSSKLDLDEYNRFANGFGFETTADQEQAIQDVIKDLASEKSMDRLVCGDVGFGKTEVALRAAFIVAMSGKQVLILSPTTLLTEQHYETFSNRFAPWALNIAEFSRFKSTKEINENIKSLNAGKIDIAIGTHKLLSKDIQVPNLGLIIIDEEHRFGVRQKELIKNMRLNVDILALTATPIPRTLGMALEGLREFSVIATAPQKRLSVKTFVRKEEKSTLREGILREIKRGGQVYFLHNDIDTIEHRKRMLEELAPEANIGIAHGQMHSKELEQVMHDFHNQKINILLCTTIIETGIDVASANTIIINRADCFGLAQLHQLRGRVGRSHHQAYAYLLVPDFDDLTNLAKRRLEAIQNLQELGSGFYLAMHDLEIRGAGEILGDKQSGEMQQIGFNLYTEMLNLAVKGMKSGEKVDLMAPLQQNIEIELGGSAILPEKYIIDVHARLSLYKKLANCTSDEQIFELRADIIDRYGKMPENAVTLIRSHLTRLQANTIGIQKLVINTKECNIWFKPTNNVKPELIIKIIQSRKDIQLCGEHRLKIVYHEGMQHDKDKKYAILQQLLSEIY
jgi:transcription-repair coupling factor (superfamily II helicase)